MTFWKHLILSSACGVATLWTAAPAEAAGLAAKDDAYVTVSGIVSSVGDSDEFELNYGEGIIRVDTNDAWPNLFKDEANNVDNYLQKGDRVVVNGRIDDNWFAKKEINAESLRFQHGGQIISYNRDDKNDWNLTDEDNAYLKDEGMVRVSGVITKVEDEDSYVLRTGGQGSLMIDASDLEEGQLNGLKVGDRVLVTGELDETIFNKREIEADSIQRVGTSSQQSRL